MKLMIDDGTGKKPLPQMSFAQSKQAIAIADCVGRLIPHEGIDYDTEIIFKGQYDPSVSMNIIAHTDKGEFWKKYVMEMIRKYPPTVENPEQARPEEQQEKFDDKDKESEDAKDVS